MSESMRRRNSSKQQLQNLIRVTEQRSLEDAEEVERERRRRAREKQRGEEGPSWSEPPNHSHLTHNTESDEESKPSCCLAQDEDEGFSDWSHRLENRNEQEIPDDSGVRELRPSAPPAPEEEKQLEENREQEGRREQEQSAPLKEATAGPREKTSSVRNRVRASYSSSVFLAQDSRSQEATGQPLDRASYLAAGTMSPRGGTCRMDGEVVEMEEELSIVQREQSPPEPPRHEAEDEDEDLSFTCGEKEDIHLMREQIHRDEEEELWNDEVQETQIKTSTERDRRSGDTQRTQTVPVSSEGKESLNCYGPMSPTFKKLLIQFYPDEVNYQVSPDGKCTITERTESLRRSTNSVKKTQPPVPVSKIDKRLKQYTYALQVSTKESRAGCPVLTDLTSPSEPVASKKNLFEAGEAWNQSNISVTPSKDADVLKVGVADLINQWVKGSEDGSRCSSPSKPAEIKPGGVLNKKNLWESLGDALPSGREGKENSLGKKYKFTVTGHGKYEKVSADSGCSEDVTYQSAAQVFEDL
ncbi:uncharacterized protein KZ484_001567 isoform 2-T2 [Pholidichthys leucotaenia]